MATKRLLVMQDGILATSAAIIHYNANQSIESVLDWYAETYFFRREGMNGVPLENITEVEGPDLDDEEAPFGISQAKGEMWATLTNGNVIAFESGERNEFGTSYIRVLNTMGDELGYWDNAEWEEEPVEVMGAICGAMLSTVPLGTNYYQFGPDSKFPEGVDFDPYEPTEEEE